MRRKIPIPCLRISKKGRLNSSVLVAMPFFLIVLLGYYPVGLVALKTASGYYFGKFH